MVNEEPLVWGNDRMALQFWHPGGQRLRMQARLFNIASQSCVN